MNTFISMLILCGILLVGMFVFSNIGRKIGNRQLQRNPNGLDSGTGSSVGAIFALLGLLIAFTFTGAASRFEDRRHLIVEEANNIGTAYLRIDLLAPEDQPALREQFKRYTDLRISSFNDLHKTEQVKKDSALIAKLQKDIWQDAIVASKNPRAMPDATKLLLPALNAMIDITATRSVATHNHPPVIIYCLLIVLSLLSALLIGYDTAANKNQAWLHRAVFAITIIMSFYIIIDLEYPRFGLIRIDADDQVLIDTRNSM